MRTNREFLSCLLFAAPVLLIAKAAVATDRPTPIEVPCLCQSDLRRAVLAQAGTPDDAVAQKDIRKHEIQQRLYRDGYRPVRYAVHNYWCRIDGPETGSRIANYVRCDLDWIIEDVYRNSHF
jgi:hypothetical protein